MTSVHLPLSVRSLNAFVASLVFAWFPLLSACRFTEFDTSVICHVLIHCLGSFLMQDMSPIEGQKYRKHVVYLRHNIVTPGPVVLLKLRASTVCRFLSWISYLSYVFLRKHRSFTSRKLYVCLETFLCFLHIFDRSYVSRARCIGLFLLLFVLTPHDSNVAVYAQVC